MMRILLSYFFIMVFFSPFVTANEVSFEKKTLSINGVNLQTEIAVTEAQREQGLMHRKNLDKDSGMLFVMDGDQAPCFWMKDTYIPLSLAYIDSTGKILQIEALQPEDTTPICSKYAIRYALEVPQGWFNQKGIKEGMMVEGINHSTP